MKSGGDKLLAKQMANEFMTELLGVDATSAPETQPLSESEPRVENVRMDCDDSFHLTNSNKEKELVSWVRDIAYKWCRAWSFARGLSKVVAFREGGWKKIERDMETSVENYADVIESLKHIILQTPQEILGIFPDEVNSIFLKIGVSAIFKGMLEEPLRSNAFSCGDEDTLHEAAREMRMKIYFERVQEKLMQWKSDGEGIVYEQARVADIAQFHGMISRHVHGMSKEDFWGLWKAAKNTKNAEKIAIFLSSANKDFCEKHYTKERTF